MRIVAGAGMRDHEGILRARYANDRSFVHPDLGPLRRLLAGRSAFLAHGRARAFAARDGGRPVGFAVAFVDPRLQSRVDRAVGSVGFLEALDGAAASAVIGAACDWLAAQGTTEAWAPYNGHSFYGAGLREDRFDEPPLLGCAHDPPVTRGFLEACGFAPLTRYLNFEVDLAGDPWRAVPADAGGVRFRPTSRRRFRSEVARFVTLYNRAFRDVWGAAELSIAEGLELVGRARLAVTPSLFQFAMAGGAEVGFVFCMPDLNEAVAPLHRPLTSPQGVARVLARRRRVRTVALLSVGVVPEHRGRGVGTALVARACRAAADLGYRRLEYALVAEGNAASRATIARFGGRPCRTFGVYRKAL